MEIAQIIIPSLVALVVPLVTYLWLTRRLADYQTVLSKEIEDYKKEISKELETHKIQLQSEFQTKFYEFQTKFSIYHQKKAEVIENVFELLAKLQNDLHLWIYWDEIPDDFYKKKDKTREELKEQIDLDNHLLTDIFDKKRIFFDSDTKDNLLEVFQNINEAIKHNNLANKSKKTWGNSSITSLPMIEFAKNDVAEIYPLMTKLENEFRQLLSAENAEYKIKNE